MMALTKEDKQDIKGIVTEAVSGLATKDFVEKFVGDEIEGQSLMISESFTDVQRQLDGLELTSGRIERKLDSTVERLDNHSLDIKALKEEVFGENN